MGGFTDKKAFTGLRSGSAGSAGNAGARDIEPLLRELEDMVNQGGYPNDVAEATQIYRQRVDAASLTMLAGIWRELVAIGERQENATRST
jgi:hypothetical protein